MEETKNKKALIMAVIIALILIVGIFGVVFSSIKSSEGDLDKEYTIHYSYDNNEYDIVFKDRMINITKYNQVMCFKAPCDPIKEDSKVVNYKKEYKYLIDNLFDNKNEVKVKYDDLDKKSRGLIHEIIGVKIKETIGYKIVDVDDHCGYEERGYYLENTEDGKLLVTISMGEQSTGGFLINIFKINIVADEAIIYVEEVEPPKDAIVTMALTTPGVKVLFDKPLKIALVQNIDTKYEFKEIE